MKVLFLSEWYPHRYDAMAGLFVRKHAEAVARQGVEVCVLYVHPDSRVTENEIVVQHTHGVSEYYVYFADSPLRALWQGWQAVQEQWGRPDVVQLNVLSKTSLLTGYLRLRYHIPYIIVEHWSGYLPENYSFRGGWHAALMRHIAAKASYILPVSQRLEDAMKACGIRNAHWARIHNVVDDFFYEPHLTPNKASQPFTFLHVSCFDEKAKNIRGILRATKQLSEQRQDFRLRIIGTGADFEMVKTYSDQLQQTDNTVFFDGEKTPEQVAQAMYESDAFVLFSRYENAPVVLSEAIACGLPIIASHAGGIPEMVTPECGVLVPSEDEDALAKAMLDMMQNRTDYDTQIMHDLGRQYSYEAVGKQLTMLYNASIHSF